jgi:hypothetical protein
VRQHPDVLALDSFRNVDLVYENLTVLGAGTFSGAGAGRAVQTRQRARSCGRPSARTP